MGLHHIRYSCIWKGKQSLLEAWLDCFLDLAHSLDPIYIINLPFMTILSTYCPCTTLHYTSLHYTTLHYTALHCTIALHCTELHCTTQSYPAYPVCAATTYHVLIIWTRWYDVGWWCRACEGSRGELVGVWYRSSPLLQCRAAHNEERSRRLGGERETLSACVQT